MRARQDDRNRPPHATHVTHVVSRLGVNSATGLRAAEIEERRTRFGANRLPEPPRQNLFRLFLNEFKSVVVALLAAAAIISIATGALLDAVVIAVVLLLNAVIGFITEWQAGRALEALRAQTRVTARVCRDNCVTTIDAGDLVVGDMVLLGEGERVPADLRLTDASALTADESVLTGESASVAKSIDPVSEHAPVADRTSMMFLGSSVAAGRGRGVVTAVGSATELGKIGALVAEVQSEITPLQKRLDVLGRRLVWIVLAVAAIVVVSGWIRGEPLTLMAEIGITLAVAAVPEALPAVTTFILAFGVLRMARRHAIVRRLTAVEALGSTTVICTDKTGTLTMNRMTAAAVWLPDGRTIRITEAAAVDHDLERAIDVMVLCNDATATTGDPTEIALLGAAQQLGFDHEAIRGECPRVAEHPFVAKSRRMITIHRDGGSFLFVMKGGTSAVLDACANANEVEIRNANRDMASSGLRILALARKQAKTPSEDPFHGYEFAGLVGLNDPPRPGVAEAVAAAQSAGIRVVMLTGDQADTAHAVAHQLHVAESDAFSRVSPEDKYRIVARFQEQGEVVAVTGDGVNDAPALKKADVGVAMGLRGTDVAKEAADIVLTDDNFATIVAAIESGRTIYANIAKFVHMMLSHNLAEIVTIFIPIVAGWPLPLLPLQVLWLNLATDVFPAFGLALEPPAAGTMKQPPRRHDELLGKSRLIEIGWQAAILAATALACYRWALLEYGAGIHARTVALFALVGVQIGQTLNCRSRTNFSFAGIAKSPFVVLAIGAVIGLQLAVAHSSTLQKLLGLQRPVMADWIVFVIAIAAPMIVVDAVKAVRNYARRNQ